jgi:dihydrofolate reductase
MRKLKLQVQMTVDGFVAGPNGELDWMNRQNDDKLLEFINALTDSSDTILLGRKMTDGFVRYWENVVNNQPESPEFSFAKKMLDTPKVVFTKTLDRSTWNNTVLAKGNLAEEIANLKNQSGKDIVVYGGAGFVSSLIREGLIDEYHLFINPTAIGSGLTIFSGLTDKLKFEVANCKAYDCGEIVVTYTPIKART